MIVALSFIGNLPKYIIESIHQIRCFYSDDVYLIINDFNSPYLESIKKYNVILVNYNNVIHYNFLETIQKNRQKFLYVHGLSGREELFVRSFERFFLLKNLLEQKKLNDCLFLELDNLIYDDPHNWIEQFSKNELCYMYDNENRFSSGLMYVRNDKSLDGFLNCCLHFIRNSNEFMSEMRVLGIYYESNKDIVEILPTYWENSTVPQITCFNYHKYNDSIFDALGIGCNLLGSDPFHTKGVIKYNMNLFSAINYTNLQFEWKNDDNGRRRPFVWNGEKWILINNLHVHSKDLLSGLSMKL